MATDKPRITITLPVNIHQTITELARLQGVSKSSLVVDLLGTVHTPLMRTVALLQAAEDAPVEVKEGLLAAFTNMEKELSQAQGISETQLDLLGSMLGVGDGASPHVVTRGSGLGEATKVSSGTKPKKPRKTKG